MNVREITACRACKGEFDGPPLIDLGNLCVSGFLKPGEESIRAPLALVRCRECGLVQLTHTVDRDLLYRKYWYRSGTNERMVAALQDVVKDAVRRVQLHPADMVLDIGANDGTLLRQFSASLRRYGFDPADLAPHDLGDEHSRIWRTYFPPAEGFEFHGQAKIITSIACFYDLDDPSVFVAAIKEWLHPQGVWILQMPDLYQMLNHNAFDNICHEHLTYWTYRALYDLFARHGLRIEHMTSNDVNGASTRYVVKHDDGWARPQKHHALWSTDWMANFAGRVEKLKRETVALLEKLRSEGKLVLGWGASTKGNTLLQYYGITPDLMPAIADRNPDKWGLRTAGTCIPIISEEEARRMKPDAYFLLPWHFLETFKEREQAFLAGGGVAIVPLPELRMLGGGGEHADVQSAGAQTVAGATLA